MQNNFNLSDVKNSHKGSRAIVCGSGWSLNSFNFDALPKSDIIFACNHAVTALKHCNYFCIADGAVTEANFFEYGTGISDKVVFLRGASCFASPTVMSLYDKLKDKLYVIDHRNSASNFDFNLNDGLLITGTDVVHGTTHLAHMMGCSPIILVGVDLNYKNGKKYCDSSEFKKEVQWSTAQGYRGKWFYSQNPSGDDDFSLTNSFSVWKAIKDINKDVVLLNANPQGKLSTLFNSYIP